MKDFFKSFGKHIFLFSLILLFPVLLHAEGDVKIKAAMEQIEELEHDRQSLYNLISSGSKRADREEELRASIAFKTANLERATFSASSASIYKPSLTVKKLPSEDFESEQLFEVRFTFGGNDVLSATVGENLGFKQSDNIEAELFYTVSVDEENYSAYILHLKYLELKVLGESEKQRLDVNADFFYQHTPIISLDFSAKKSQNANIFNSENPGMENLEPSENSRPKILYYDNTTNFEWSSVLLFFPGLVSCYAAPGNSYWTLGYKLGFFWPNFFTSVKLEADPATVMNVGIIAWDIFAASSIESGGDFIEPIDDGFGDELNATLSCQAGLHYDFSPSLSAMCFAECGLIHSSFGAGLGGGVQANYIFDSSSLIGIGLEFYYTCLWTTRDKDFLHRFSLGTHLIF